MDTLELARQEINAVDHEIATLFQRRMKAVESVIAYKLQHGLPIFDSSREAQVIARNCKLIQDPVLVEYFKEYLHFQMDLSKRYQQAILEQEARSRREQ